MSIGLIIKLILMLPSLIGTIIKIIALIKDFKSSGFKSIVELAIEILKLILGIIPAQRKPALKELRTNLENAKADTQIRRVSMRDAERECLSPECLVSQRDRLRAQSKA